MPIPLIRPAIVVATCVPWPWRSWTAALFEQLPFATSAGSAVGVELKMNEHDPATSIAPARSGWVKSSPPSITPTFTPLPLPTAWAAVALMTPMSH
jgi:hypothetical protein